MELNDSFNRIKMLVISSTTNTNIPGANILNKMSKNIILKNP